VTGIFSCRKALTTLSIHMAVDRGLLDYDLPVARWWPEFAKNGKEKVTIRQVLTHQVGLPVIGLAGEPESFTDVRSAIEALTPVWAPGTDIGYSATFDPILQVVLERVFDEPLDD
jgi:CubicO group peptidase (beta-lactamase class C family)